MGNPTLLEPDASTPDASGGAGPDASRMDAAASPAAGGGGSANLDDAAPGEDVSTWNPAVDDCDQPSLQLVLANGSFDRNDQDWDVDSNANKDWSNDDSAGESSSGSLSLTNKRVGSGMGLTAASVSQCLQIPRNVGFHICVDYLLSSGLPSTAAASVNLVLFDGDACSGAVSTSPSIQPDAEKGGWQTFKARMTAPPEQSTYKSMLVKLVAIKGLEEAPLDVQFDNVRIGAVPR